MILRELRPIHDSRKSFYRKALVVYQGLNISLISYDTLICTIKKNGKLVMKWDESDLSVTTKRHFREFCEQFKDRIEE